MIPRKEKKKRLVSSQDKKKSWSWENKRLTEQGEKILHGLPYSPDAHLISVLTQLAYIDSQEMYVNTSAPLKIQKRMHTL